MFPKTFLEKIFFPVRRTRAENSRTPFGWRHPPQWIYDIFGGAGKLCGFRNIRVKKNPQVSRILFDLTRNLVVLYPLQTEKLFNPRKSKQNVARNSCINYGQHCNIIQKVKKVKQKKLKSQAEKVKKSSRKSQKVKQKKLKSRIQMSFQTEMEVERQKSLTLFLFTATDLNTKNKIWQNSFFRAAFSPAQKSLSPVHFSFLWYICEKNPWKSAFFSWKSKKTLYIIGSVQYGEGLRMSLFLPA